MGRSDGDNLCLQPHDRPHYRKDLDGWIVIVHEMMAGGTIPSTDPRRFKDQVMAFVGTGGRACIIETKTRDGSFITDPRTIKPKCP